MKTHKVGWKVSLSNGETLYEGKGEFQVTPEKKISPWHRMISYVVENGLKITSLSLYTDEGRNFHVPSSGSNPGFHEFYKNGKPNDYRFFHALSSTSGVVNGLYTVAEAIYDTHRVQLWVSEEDTNNCWVVAVVGKE